MYVVFFFFFFFFFGGGVFCFFGGNHAITWNNVDFVSARSRWIRLRQSSQEYFNLWHVFGDYLFDVTATSPGTMSGTDGVWLDGDGNKSILCSISIFCMLVWR